MIIWKKKSWIETSENVPLCRIMYDFENPFATGLQPFGN